MTREGIEQFPLKNFIPLFVREDFYPCLLRGGGSRICNIESRRQPLLILLDLFPSAVLFFLPRFLSAVGNSSFFPSLSLHATLSFFLLRERERERRTDGGEKGYRRRLSSLCNSGLVSRPHSRALACREARFCKLALQLSTLFRRASLSFSMGFCALALRTNVRRPTERCTLSSLLFSVWPRETQRVIDSMISLLLARGFAHHEAGDEDGVVVVCIEEELFCR